MERNEDSKKKRKENKGRLFFTFLGGISLKTEMMILVCCVVNRIDDAPLLSAHRPKQPVKQPNRKKLRFDRG